MWRYGLGIVVIFAQWGCTGAPRFDKVEYKTIDMRNAAADLSVPKSLLAQLEAMTESDNSAPKVITAKSTKAEGSEVKPTQSVEAVAEGEVGMVAPKIDLVEVSKGILHGQNYQMQMGRGGGTLDLADYVEIDTKGDFYLGFDIPGIDQATVVKVFFLSRTKRQKVAGQIYGIGCNQYVDISHYFKSQIRKNGLLLTTLHDIYAQTALGSFIFLFLNDDRWQVAEVTITDARQEALFCPHPGDIAKTLIDELVRSTVNL